MFLHLLCALGRISRDANFFSFIVFTSLTGGGSTEAVTLLCQKLNAAEYLNINLTRNLPGRVTRKGDVF